MKVSEAKINVTYLAAGVTGDIVFPTNKIIPFKILHIGGCASNKNLDNTIKAIRAVVQKGYAVELHVIGRVATHEADYWITYHGQVDDASLRNHYSTAFALLFLSTYEGFGIPILEAMTFGVVVIATRYTSVPEIAGECAIYVDPNNIDDIATGICNVIDHKTIVDDMINRGYQHASRFSWQRCANQTIETYYSAIKN